MPETKPVAPVDPAKKSSDIVKEDDSESTVQLGKLGQKCFWNDEEFETGDRINLDGKVYECSMGRWVPG